MDLTHLRSSATERRVSALKRIVLGVALAGGFGWLIVAGLPQTNTSTPVRVTNSVHLSQPLVMRLDTVLPGCDSRKVIDGILGLVRGETVRVTGLSDIYQVEFKPNGDRTCRAMVNLEFGTRHVSYVIQRTGPGRTTWELTVTEG